MRKIENPRYIRTFIAIPLPPEVKGFLIDIQKRLRASGIKASWSRPSTLHLTLKFLGDIDIRRLDIVENCMVSAVANIPVFSLFATGLGVFPSVKNTRVIWSGTGGETDWLEKTVHQLDFALFERLGLQRDTRRFSSHLTIARVKKYVPPKTMVPLLQELMDCCSQEFSVSKIQLIQSILGSSHAIHKPIFSVPLLLQS